MEIIFVKTRWYYQSYTDFWKLVELARFRTCYVDEMDLSQNVTYVVSPMNGEWRPYIDDNGKGRKARLVLWNLERPGGSSNSVEKYEEDNRLLIIDDHVDMIMVSDIQLAQDTGFKHIILGSDPKLGMFSQNIPKDYDLIHLSCFSQRRSWLFDAPHLPIKQYKGLKIASNGWGSERHQRLHKSRYMLCTHQDEFLYIEPLRYTLAAAYGLPILSEPVHNPYPYNPYIFNHRNQLKDIVSHIHSELYNNNSYNIWNTMTKQFTFRRCVEMVLS